jgi:GMP synthase (glutamine-hydrolysing)
LYFSISKFVPAAKSLRAMKKGMVIKVKKEIVIVLDFGGQYNQLIARRVRECDVYCEVLPYYTSIERIKELEPKGIIFTGGPASVYEADSPTCDARIFSLGIPILGICYGCHLMTYLLGGKAAKAPVGEYGKTEIEVNKTSRLFYNVPDKTTCWMSHKVYIETPAEGFIVTASSKSCPIAAVEDTSRNLYGVQFHPEVVHTPEGTKMLHNFLYNVCNCSGDWKMSSFTEQMIKTLKQKIGDKKVLCALSGGVDSSVAAVMVSKAVGKQLTCIFVDHGLLRKNEGDEVEEVFTKIFDVNFVRVNAKERFYNKLAGVTEPEKKRKIIGEEFIRVFEEEAKKIGTVDYLVQGTIYPDVIESGLGKSAVIKSHHNVGGLPDYVDFKEIIEPLRSLFKDEVRRAGLELGIPDKLVYRQPFPGPGLAIRIIGDITPEKVALLQDADYIYRDEIAKAGLDKKISQYFAVLTNLRSVGVMGDERTYDYTVALRAVTTTDFMTAEFAEIPWEVLGNISNRIVNEVKHVNRICYDITGKPPATIEWE